MERGYKADDVKEKVEQASNVPRETLLQETQNNNSVSSITDNILQQTHPRHLPNHEEKLVYIEDKRKITKKFEGDPIRSFKRTRNLREIICGSTIKEKNGKL